MLESYRAVKRRIPQIRKNAGGGSLFEAAVFNDLVLASLEEAKKRTTKKNKQPSPRIKKNDRA
jgi:hypothetical protein